MFDLFFCFGIFHISLWCICIQNKNIQNFRNLTNETLSALQNLCIVAEKLSVFKMYCMRMQNICNVVQNKKIPHVVYGVQLVREMFGRLDYSFLDTPN